MILQSELGCVSSDFPSPHPPRTTETALSLERSPPNPRYPLILDHHPMIDVYFAIALFAGKGEDCPRPVYWGCFCRQATLTATASGS